jgi:hypothetical protein
MFYQNCGEGEKVAGEGKNIYVSMKWRCCESNLLFSD